MKPAVHLWEHLTRLLSLGICIWRPWRSLLLLIWPFSNFIDLKCWQNSITAFVAPINHKRINWSAHLTAGNSNDNILSFCASFSTIQWYSRWVMRKKRRSSFSPWSTVCIPGLYSGIGRFLFLMKEWHIFIVEPHFWPIPWS